MFCVARVSLFWVPMKSLWQEGLWTCERQRWIWVLHWRRRFLEHDPCPYEYNAQSFAGLLFPTGADNAIWVQLFHLNCLWKSQGGSRGKAQKLNPVLLPFLTKIGTRSMWAPLEMDVPCWRRGSDAQCYLLLHVRLYLKLLSCVPIFARKDRAILIWWLHCILPLGRYA